MILNPFLFLFIAYEVRFWSLLWRKLLFESPAAQCPKGSDGLCLQAALAFNRIRACLGWPLRRFTVSASLAWRKVLFQSIDNCSLRWLCCWPRCWILQVMGNVEARCVFYVKVGMCTDVEQNIISQLSVEQWGIQTLTVRYDMIVSVIFMKYPMDYLRQTSADGLSLKLLPIYM